MEHVDELLGSAAGQAKFIDWVSDEVTQLVLQDLRGRLRPRYQSSSGSALDAVAELGRLRGIQETIDIFTRRRGAEQPGGAGLPSADYGARDTQEDG